VPPAHEWPWQKGAYLREKVRRAQVLAKPNPNDPRSFSCRIFSFEDQTDAQGQ